MRMSDDMNDDVGSQKPSINRVGKATSFVALRPNADVARGIGDAGVSSRRRLLSLKPSRVETQKGNVWDKLGIFLSTLCLIHCALTPVILVLLPASQFFFASEGLHQVLALVLPAVAIFAFIPGYSKHGDRRVFYWSLPGVVLIGLAAFNAFSLLNIWTETLITISGSLLLIRSHILNRQLRACCGGQHVTLHDHERHGLKGFGDLFSFKKFWLLMLVWSVLESPSYARNISKAHYPKGQCVVDGHGPYDLDIKKCLQLAQDQARTNCVLHDKTDTSTYQFTPNDKPSQKRKGQCSYSKKVGQAECQAGKCLDTASQN